MVKWFYQLLIELTNHRISSYILRKFSQSKISRIVIPTYLNVYNIKQEEVRDDIRNFQTLHELFVRRLKEEVRPINQENNSVVSPVDAVIEEIGEVLPSKEIIVKGKNYSIREMLGDEEVLKKYIGGTFLILYLSPSHYHRIHSPVSGTITKQWTLGKKSYPVNKLGLKYGKDTLSKNYRRITEIETDGKHTAMVKVGAMFVNSIELTHQHEVLQKGEEMAYFTFGSTVILLFEKGSFTASETIQTPHDIHVGQVLGYLK